MWKRTTAMALFAVAVLGGTAACSSSSATVETPTSAATTVPVAESTVVDVRTPEEFAAGHLAGATNINIESGDFTAQISALPKDAAYLVYCRSGNRSANAVAQMKQQGFTNVADIGGLQEASSATGLPVVQ